MEYKEFLKSTLPQLGLRWRRFNRKSIRNRIVGRLQELNLHSLSEYQSYVFASEVEKLTLTCADLVCGLRQRRRTLQSLDSLA
jgi:hypothetical protein